LYFNVYYNSGLVRAQYTHEFMTNYDIDEIIFPRFYNTNLAQALDKSNKIDCKRELDSYSKTTRSYQFNIYELAKKLKTIHGADTAFFAFPHVLVLNEYEQMYSLLRKAVQESKTNTSFEYNFKFLTFGFLKIRYSINSEADLEYAKSLVRAIDYVSCLNRTFLEAKQDVFDPKWTRTLATVFPKQLGKPIFNTEHTFSVTPHYADNYAPGTKAIYVPIDFGYVNHIRDRDIFDPDILHYSVQSIKIDIEFLNFIVKISDHFSV
jgi:hypothetical protein